MSFNDLYKLYKEEKNTPETGIKDMPTKTITNSKGGTMSKKTGIMAKVNYHSKNALGSVGRPVAVATGSGFGAYYAGHKFDVDFLQNGYNCAAIGVGTAVAVEGALHYFGDDTALRVKDSVVQIDSFSKDEEWMKDREGTDQALLSAGLSQDALDGLNTIFDARQAEAEVKKKVKKGNVA